MGVFATLVFVPYNSSELYWNLDSYAMSTNVLFLGSSHIRRFENYMKDNHKGDFDLTYDGKVNVYFHGISGGKVSNAVHTRMLTSTVQHCKPDIIFVQIGGNDVDQHDMDEDGVKTLILRLVNICELWTVRHNVKYVVIGQFLFRTRTRHINPDRYNEFVLLANRTLKADLAGRKHIKLWAHKGLKNPVTACLADGVHLNQTGFYKLYRSTRGAILHCLRGERQEKQDK